MKEILKPSLSRYLAAWMVHGFTASAAYLGLYTLYSIYQHHYVQAFWLMAITIFIDAIDGTLARSVQVKKILPKMDGTLLDNIVDYLNYVITPCFFLMVKPGMLPSFWAIPLLTAIVLSSAYQFCQTDAKTPDHFFKGFPCYWNIAVFYMFIFDTSMFSNFIILSILCILIFVPIKYVYPSRLDYLTSSKSLKILMHVFSIIYGISSSLVLWSYPKLPSVWMSLSVGYIGLYLILSIYRTYSPIKTSY